MKITVPKGSVFSSVTSGLSYDLTSKDPAGSIAKVQYYWDDRNMVIPSRLAKVTNVFPAREV